MTYVDWSENDKRSIVIALIVLMFLTVATGVAAIVQCYCGRENEYTLLDVESAMRTYGSVDSDTIAAENTDTDASNKGSGASVPTKIIAEKVVFSKFDNLANEIDYFVRHMDNFSVVGFYCSMEVLENHLGISENWKSRSLREFIKNRPEFELTSNMNEFRLTRLTPFRTMVVEVSGKFQCVDKNCREFWESVHSFSDHFQRCPNCSSRVYPFEQSERTATHGGSADGSVNNLGTFQNIKNEIDYMEVITTRKLGQHIVPSVHSATVTPPIKSYNGNDATNSNISKNSNLVPKSGARSPSKSRNPSAKMSVNTAASPVEVQQQPAQPSKPITVTNGVVNSNKNSKRITSLRADSQDNKTQIPGVWK